MTNPGIGNLTDRNPNPLEVLSSKEKAAIVNREVFKMPEHMQVVTVLVLMENLSQKGAAEILGLSEASVSRHLEAAKNWLRERLIRIIY